MGIKSLFIKITQSFSKTTLSQGVVVRGMKPLVNQRIVLKGKGLSRFGDRVIFGWKDSPSFASTYSYIEARRKNSHINIERDCIFNNDCSIVSEHENDSPSISIGARSIFGPRFRCYDNDFHGIRAKDRHSQPAIKTAPIKIGEDCFFGEACFVLKGVELGDRCVVGAGSVVTTSFPSDSIIAGNPAKLIRKIDQLT